MSSPSTAGKNLEEGTNEDAYHKAAARTLASINEAVSVDQLTYFSNRSITEVQALQEEVAAVVPAGNIVGLVLSGLVRLRGRSLPEGQAKSDVSALMRGIEMLPRNILPQTLYGTFFAGPAAVLSAYQKLLTLSGKDLDSSFPDGLWQFYLEFAMREDTARHTNETLGFQNALADYNLALSPSDQLAAWVCAVAQIYFQYDELLHNEWRERVYLSLLEKTVAEARLGHKLSFQRLPQAWAAQRPYKRGQDVGHDENYPLYRRRRFDNFLQSRLAFLPALNKTNVDEVYARRLRQELPAYQQQMTILATLDPERYRENRVPIPLWQTRIAVILEHCYYLLPVCQNNHLGQPLLFDGKHPDASFQALRTNSEGNLYDPTGQLLRVDRTGQVYQVDTDQIRGYLRPTHFQAIRRQVAAIFEHHRTAGLGQLLPAKIDEQLICIGRAEQERARREIRSEVTQQELEALKYAPVVINWDQQEGSNPLTYIRRGKRGIGDGALTIFRTETSIVFDQSHIFFDGTWGMALSEILTDEAISWAAYFNSLTPPEPANQVPFRLRLSAEPSLEKLPKKITPEVAAENTGINTKALYELRKLLPKRHPELKLTVNDLLILYRCEFGHEYRPSSTIEDLLFELRADTQSNVNTQDVYQLTNEILVKSQVNNPALMIPMDATATSPRERLYPTTFRNPFAELWANYREASTALKQYTATQTQTDWATFTNARRSLLAQLNYFGQLLRAYKKIALEGGSTTTATMKLVAHLPPYFLKLLDEIPQRIDILNEIIKGEEVFSNVGRVARDSSLSRFTSAKDDNPNKDLVWGILTDDDDMMHLTLRDFRPHVAALHKLNKIELAEMMAKDYLDAFVTGFNQFATRLLEILHANATHSFQEVAE